MVLLLSTSVLSSGLPSSDWYSYYAGDQAPAESPIYWSGGVGGSPKSGHWQQSYQGTIRRQDKDAPGKTRNRFAVKNFRSVIGKVNFIQLYDLLLGIMLIPISGIGFRGEQEKGFRQVQANFRGQLYVTLTFQALTTASSVQSAMASPTSGVTWWEGSPSWRGFRCRPWTRVTRTFTTTWTRN